MHVQGQGKTGEMLLWIDRSWVFGRGSEQPLALGVVGIRAGWGAKLLASDPG